ncbi:MAG: 3-dehydro-L-gulonate 2-dehydrogenase [Acidobacteria bacterium]|nr:3-dehydro-L-gulonate 2-dehydrogenase [Acidobacteriota bacterium]
MIRVPFHDLYSALHKAMLALGLPEDRARRCAQLFAETTRDGVYTHGLNRFPRFSAMVRNGSIHVDATPTLAAAFGAIERWNGNLGIGNLNAQDSMARAIELARKHGIGAVALANSNHWMRGGAFGWQAADEGMFAICWSNTLANVPVWGATTPAIGNNPLVLAVPRAEGNIVLDMAMSQFSYGTLASYSKRDKPLPVPGGYDVEGKLTDDAAAIEGSQRALPIGYWKGSGLAVVLDAIAAMLSGGTATHQFDKDPQREAGQSQIFLVIDPAHLAAASELNHIADGIVDSLRQATPIDPAKPVRYPGEQTLQLREENMRLGVPVDEDVWREVGEGRLSKG